MWSMRGPQKAKATQLNTVSMLEGIILNRQTSRIDVGLPALVTAVFLLIVGI